MTYTPQSLRWLDAKPPQSGFCIFRSYFSPITNVHIDGFNPYGAMRKPSYRCLDVEKVCQLLLPRNTLG